MPVVFPKENNPYWPLPADYSTLSNDGMRRARVNACSIGGTAELEVAGWDYFRREYLYDTPKGMFYKHGIKPSPLGHYQWVDSWYRYPLSTTAAPRSGAKSSIIRENLLRNLFVRPYQEEVLFLSTQSFVTESLDMLMTQIEHNEHLIADFGALKPSRNQGIWNHKQLKLANGAMLSGMSIKGAALGKRPHGMWFDDVERDDSLISEPTELIEAFKKFFFNVVYPMAEEGVRIRVIGTIGNSRRTFMFWLQKSKDKRLTFWKRNFHAVIEQTGPRKGQDFWTEKMGKEWQARQLAIMGQAAFDAQYMNQPGSDQDKILSIHPELNTWWIEEPDELLATKPLHSKAPLIACVVDKWTGEDDRKVGWGEGIPIPKKIVRQAGEVFSTMRRFITVDYAKTQTDTSDFSVVHVMGLQNVSPFRDTLYSLDLQAGRWKPRELTKRIYLLAQKWQVGLIGIEAFPVQMEFYERAVVDLPEMYGLEGVAPRVYKLNIPTRLSKPEKIMGLEWRFRRYKVKLPIHLSDKGAYRMLWYQTENFTEDLGLLRYDDCLDTLAMHQFIGKSRGEPLPDRGPATIIWDEFKAGEMVDENGIPYMSGINASQMPNDVLQSLLQQKYDMQMDEAGNPVYHTWR